MHYKDINVNPVVKFKKLHPEAKIPTRATEFSGGYDVVAVEDGVKSKDLRYIEYATGLAVEIPVGYQMKIMSRSSVSKKDLVLCNGEGLADCDYRGELKLRFKYVPSISLMNTIDNPRDAFLVLPEESKDDKGYYHCEIYKKGDVIGQLKLEVAIYPIYEEATELTETERGQGGFGSTDKKKT